MRVKRVVSMLMVLMMTIVSATSVAAAMCAHKNADEHIAALASDDAGTAAGAHLEDTAGAAVSKKGALADAGAFSIHAFILPDASTTPRLTDRPLALPRAPDAAKIPRASGPPLLEPPAA
jgi:hypothetical protein